MEQRLPIHRDERLARVGKRELRALGDIDGVFPKDSSLAIAICHEA
jgi:hypothetical protein